MNTGERAAGSDTLPVGPEAGGKAREIDKTAKCLCLQQFLCTLRILLII
jgi:hypothetical protein